MSVSILRWLVPAAAVLMLLFLAGRVDAIIMTDGDDTVTVYQNGQQPVVRNSRVRQRRPVQRVRRHRRAVTQVSSDSGGVTSYSGGGTTIYDSGGTTSYNAGSITYSEVAIPVRDSGSTLAMFGAASLLLLRFHRLRCQRIVV